jgi:hypothetical protein
MFRCYLHSLEDDDFIAVLDGTSGNTEEKLSTKSNSTYIHKRKTRKTDVLIVYLKKHERN